MAHRQPSSDFASIADEAFAGRPGALAMIDCSTGMASDFRPEAAAQRLAPCSTFKIWNALIGMETGLVSSPGEAFYTWDGQQRPIPAWNRDLTLKEAFQASCVPAFQNLARQIGRDRMQEWLQKIGYGDRDASAGIDVFWLPAQGRKTILVSPAEQAQLMHRLATGQLPFSPKSVTVLKELMETRRTEKGVLYGKTGSGTNEQGSYALGWFTGFVESNGNTQAFACAVLAENAKGTDARALVETVLEKQGLL